MLTEGVGGDWAARQIGDRNVAGFVHRCQLRQGGLEQLNRRIEQRSMQDLLEHKTCARGTDKNKSVVTVVTHTQHSTPRADHKDRVQIIDISSTDHTGHDRDLSR